ncbi:ABC transporter substrate-binding protein [Glaciimonas sp. PCH181]|uniref:ABC transporter substrate-binding protein n=1 Tax=Glaciimonas sp. PCH181 TaxID=2133943 RepID=UPI000D3B1827|nr:ABC transporter substrate-binding protein [Glaciimonas sp. PCH181]PUA20403.1 ABC transporter substrate-binding protein [Glaciimonas sp. PCH181]
MHQLLKTGLRGLALFSLAATVGLSSARAADEPITIGFAIAESGWLQNYDSAPFKAAVLKIDEINKAGGLLGRQLKYRVIDTKTERERSASAGAELIRSGVNLLVVSCDYDFGAPAALAGQKAKVITMSLCAADPKMGVQGVGDYAFTANSAAQSEGVAIAEYAQEKLKLKTTYVLEDTTIEYSKSGCAGFRAAWAKGDGKDSILGNDVFKNNDPSIAAQITRLNSLSKKPDSVFVCSFMPGGASAIRQLRAAGINVPILGTTAMVDNYWLNAVPKLKDFYVPAFMSLYGDDPRPAMNTFIANFKARWKEAPVSSYSVLGYSLIEQWAYAVTTTHSTDSDKNLAVMNSFTNQPFLVGPTTYRKDLHIQLNRPWLILKVENGSFHAVEMYQNKFTPDKKLLFRIGG